MTVVQEELREFLSTLPPAAFPMSNGMLAHLAMRHGTPPETVAVLSGAIPEGRYKSAEQVLRAVSDPSSVRKARKRTSGSRGKPAGSRPRTPARGRS